MAVLGLDPRPLRASRAARRTSARPSTPPRGRAPSRGRPPVAVAAAAGALVLSLLAAPPTRAQDVALTARSVYHGYQLQLDPYGPSNAERSLDRFYASVEGGAYALGPSRQFDLVASFRYDTDFGTGFSASTPFGAAVPAVDGRNDVDLILLYVDWRGMIGDQVDLRFGRQIQLDDLDWYVHDGLKLTAHLWREGENRLGAELYAGVPVRFDALFSSSEALLGDGTEIYDGEEPFGGIALGGSVFFRALRDLSGSLSFRNEVVFRERELIGFGPAVVVEGPELGTPVDGGAAERALAAQGSAGSVGVQESLIGGSLGYQLRPLDLTVQGTVVFDLLTESLDRGRAALGYDPARNLHFGLEYLRIRPRFVGDSIFNWFNVFPYDRARVEADWSLYDQRLTLSAAYFYQRFGGGPTVSGLEFAGEDESHGPSGGISWRDHRFGLGLHAEGGTNFGGRYAYGGNYALAWLTGDVRFLEGRLSADARLSMTTVQEDWSSRIDEGVAAEARTTYNLAFGLTGRPADWLRARALYVQNVDPVLEGSYRIFTELAVIYR